MNNLSLAEPQRMCYNVGMLYKDFDITLIGPNVHIVPMVASDEVSCARMMFGAMYDHFTKRLGYPPETGFSKILS